MFPNDFESEFTFENTAVQIPEENPFHLLVLGDWSGNSDRIKLADRRLVEIDRDNFDEIISSLKVALDLDLSGDGKTPIHIRFRELDDFHPDKIFHNISLFSELRDVRRRLSSTDTFHSAAREVRSWFNNSAEDLSDFNDLKSQMENDPPIDSQNLLDVILNKSDISSAVVEPQVVDKSELGQFISKIVSPHLIRIDENEQSKLISAVDEVISELMRSILHHPKFKDMEAAWRGLYFLVRRIETGSDLKIYIFDVSQKELADELKSVENLADSFIYRYLKSKSFAVIAGNYSFGINIDDVAFLMRFAQLSSVFDAPFISYIKPEIFDIEHFLNNNSTLEIKPSEQSDKIKLWNALRSNSDSNYLGLSPMRTLGRLPYGVSNDSIDEFSFEELTENRSLDRLVWLNPCFAISLLLAKSFSSHGWRMRNNLLYDLDKLPIYLDSENGAQINVPCSEVFLTEKQLETIIDFGLMALISFRDTDRIKIANYQSVSFDSKALRGKWS